MQNELWGVGSNTGGQLGIGGNISRSSPIFIGIPDYLTLPQGYSSVFGVKQNGQLWGWGINTSGQLGIGNVTNQLSQIQVGTDTNWAYANGGTMSVAIKTDGTLWSTGANSNGGLGQNDTIARSSWTQVGTDTDWAPIADTNPSINYGMYVLKQNGTLWGCGDNTNGQLATGDVIDYSSMVQMGTQSYWAQVQSSGLYTYALDNIGRLWVVGYNANGRAGSGTTIATSSFVQVYGNHTWNRFAAGSSACYGIRTDGTLWSWGIGANGALGQNSVANISVPTQIGTDTNWAFVGAGIGIGAAVNTLGQLWVWGANTTGALGTGDLVDYSSPVQTIIADNNWKNVTVGGQTLYAWRLNQVTPTPSPTPSPTNSPSPTPSPSPTGSIAQYNWGDNSQAQLALNISAGLSKSSPAFVAGSEWIDGYPNGGIANGGIRKDGTLWVAGYNARGCLGINTNTNRSQYVQVGSGTDWAMVSMGITSGGVKKDGSLWMWGEGGGGGLGDGTAITKSSPIQVAADKTWKSVTGWLATTAGSLCGAITTSNDLYVWGPGSVGQMGNNTAISASSPIFVGPNYAQVCTTTAGVMAIKTDGTLWGWGGNLNNLGYNLGVTRSTPVQIGTDSNWVQLSGNQTNFAAIKSDNTVWSWGTNTGGQLATGNTIARSSPTFICNDGYRISSGNTITWVLKRDGTLWFAGSQTGNGQGGVENTTNYSSLTQTVYADNKWVHIFSGSGTSLGIRNSAGLVTPTVTPAPATPSPTPTPTETLTPTPTETPLITLGCGTCTYNAVQVGPSLQWLLDQDLCTGGCGCNPPTNPPSVAGETATTDCA